MDANSIFKKIFQPLPVRFHELFVGLIALIVGAALTYLGGRGLLDHGGPYRAACAEWWVCPSCVGAGAWILAVSLRLFRGSRVGQGALLFRPELLVVSLTIVGGSLWLFAEELPILDLRVVAFGAVGAVGLWRWWTRRRESGGFVQGPAA